MKKLSIAILLELLAGVAFSQQENYNKVWVQGSPVSFMTTFTSAGPVNQFWDSLNIQYFTNGHSNICTGAGDLLLATDGASIYNASRQIIDNGDSILSSFAYDGLGSFGTQTTIILPLGDSIYYVFNGTWSDSAAYKFFTLGQGNVVPDQVLYHVVDMKQNNYTGKVIKKKIIAIDSARLSASHMTAVRHGNGTDWWLIKQGNVSNGNGSKIYTCLVRRDTVEAFTVQNFANTAAGITFGNWSGQSAFNNSGTKYAAVDKMQYLFTADFDRCTGLFSNGQRSTIPLGGPNETAAGGVCFSPNDSFLYVSTYSMIHQLEIYNPDSATAWAIVAGADTTGSSFQGYLFLNAGQDQKIYVGHESNVGSAMSVIANPNYKGVASGFCPMCLRFPLFNGIHEGVTQPPNMPNYVLGVDPKCPPTSIEPRQNSEPFKLFPNPASTSITVEYGKGGGHFEVVDMMGRVVMTESFTANSLKATISVTSLLPGIYVYRYRAKEKMIVSGKLLIK